MRPDALRPQIPDLYSPEWEQEMVRGLAFAPAAHSLLLNDRIEDARKLCEAGVVAHPWYATGHLLLGRTYVAEERWQDARLELERTLQLDGSYPSLLDDLARCYEQLGLTELARDCRHLGRELDTRPETAEMMTPVAQNAADPVDGGEMMADEPERTPDSPEEEGAPEEFSSSGEMELDDVGSPEDALKELESLLGGADTSLAGEDDTSTASGEEDLSLAPSGSEPADTGMRDLDAIDLDAELAAPEADDKTDLWKKILEQAEAVDPEDSDSISEPGTPEGGEEAAAIDVEQIEGLEIGTPGGGSVDASEAEAVQPVTGIDEAEEPALPGADEDEDALADLEKALEGFESTELDEGGAEDSGPVEETAEVAPLEGLEEGVGSLDDSEGVDTEDSTLEDIGLDDSLGLESALPSTPAPPETPAEEPKSKDPRATDQIQTPEDSIRFAIRGEILAAQGKHKEALRLFEALKEWDPERDSFRDRVDDLRRLAE